VPGRSQAFQISMKQQKQHSIDVVCFCHNNATGSHMLLPMTTTMAHTDNVLNSVAHSSAQKLHFANPSQTPNNMSKFLLLVFLAFASAKHSQGLFGGSTGFVGVATLPVLINAGQLAMGKEEFCTVVER